MPNSIDFHRGIFLHVIPVPIIASLIGRYNFTTSKEVCISLEEIFYSFASSTDEDEFKTLCLFLFKAGCIILTKYFEVPHGRNSTVDTSGLIGWFFSGLGAFKVPYNLGGI